MQVVVKFLGIESKHFSPIEKYIARLPCPLFIATIINNAYMKKY